MEMEQSKQTSKNQLTNENERSDFFFQTNQQEKRSDFFFQTNRQEKRSSQNGYDHARLSSYIALDCARRNESYRPEEIENNQT
jgi:hypothetical protein